MRWNILKSLLIGALVCQSVACSGQTVAEFNGERAYEYLKKQCEFGPRNPGSDGHRQCLQFLVAELRMYADQVVQQPFQSPIRSGQSPVPLTNVVANFQLRNPDRILLCAHWDTRPWADQDADKSKHMQPVMGANDGASGVAVLLELARMLKQQPPRVGVDIALFDAEDFGSYGNNESWALGAKVFAERKNPTYQPRFGILLDLIGDADQQLFIERYSQYYAPDIVSLVWNTAEQLGIPSFIPESRFEVMDDHVRLLNAGIQCIDIIDFDYPYWHTTEDTPDKCSAQSLTNVGRVVTAVIYQQ